jgi:hypothetical protein
MPPAKTKIAKGKAFQPIRSSMTNNNLFKPITNKQIKATPKIQYDKFLDECRRSNNFEKNLISTYIVRVDSQDRNYDDQKFAAMSHMERHLVKYLMPHPRPNKNNKKCINLRKYSCFEHDCKYTCQLLLIGRVA